MTTTNDIRRKVEIREPDRDDSESEADDDFDTRSPLMRGSEKESENVDDRKWDIFQNPKRKKRARAYEDWGFYQNFMRFMKLLTYIIVFVLVLGSSMIGQSAVLLMTSQLQPQANRTACSEGQPLRTVEITETERSKWTWALLICLFIPEIGTFIRSARKVFKKSPRPTLFEFLVPCIFEILHAIGLGLFTFIVLPSENVVRGVFLTNCACLIPGILAIISRISSKKERFWIPMTIIDGLAILALLYGLIRWPTAAKGPGEHWVLPLAAVLTSLGWWENYLPVGFQLGLIGNFGAFRHRLEQTRYHTYLIVCLIKMATFFLTMCTCVWIIDDDLQLYFETPIFSNEWLPVTTGDPPISAYFLETTGDAILNTLLIQIFAAYLCYVCAKYACKISIQRISFALPLLLSGPLMITTLWGMCRERAWDSCYNNALFPDYLYWNCPLENFSGDFDSAPEFGYMGLIFLLCQSWIVCHIWFPKWDPLTETEALFTVPMYTAVLTEQSIMMNRKPDDGAPSKVASKVDLKFRPGTEKSGGGGDDGGIFGVGDPRWDKTPKIVACATLWHEEKDEMIAMLKSVFRMDEDNWQRRRAMESGLADERMTNYFEYSTHIFFDDAFDRKYKEKSDGTYVHDYVINKWVKGMIDAIEEGCGQVHGEAIQVSSPKKFPTPYGGRLEWTLPGGTKLTVHLKNKDKIRNRKRWSQVMYMYYLLGHKIAESGLSVERQDDIAENTYLLALDGDIDFQPHSVELLLNLMKKNDHLGAACGRIHPIGAGPMVWYQKFEYAMGHWLQKATEHMIGCVLCSPGCFSMFRAKALMDDCVLKKYTTTSEEPRHYVQYDQGEDRWLCTLLLQKGWRVEYCAASDSYTHAPEGFDEFFNQRRRWVPSTMANIMDLLLDSRETTENNPNISMPYIFYQWVLMIGAILGPGTIFLMLVGSCSVAFEMDSEASFMLNLFPILLFILVCYFCKATTQLALAKVLSLIYALIMIAVFIALILLVGNDGLMAPSSIFLLAVAASFIIAALIHPLEFTCLVHGFLYFITIPSMYLLLIIYSLFNLNNVSWGTRDSPVQVSPNQAQEEAAAAAAAATSKSKKKGKKGKIMAGLKNVVGMDNSDDSFNLSTAGLCRLSCCFSNKPRDTEEQMALIQMQKSLESITQHLGLDKAGGRNNSKYSVDQADQRKSVRIEVPSANDSRGKSSKKDDSSDDDDEDRNDLFNPLWLEDARLDKAGAQTDFLSSFENKFWQQLIEHYLMPIDEDKDKQNKIKMALKELRNKIVGAFFMFNAVFVTAMFILQLHKDDIYITWPLGATYTMSYESVDITVTVQGDYLHLEPLGVLFLAFYAIVMAVQFIAMFFHRLATFSLIMVSTSIRRGHENKDLLERPTSGNANKTVKLFKEIQNIDPDADKMRMTNGATARNKGTVMTNLHKSRNDKVPSHTLDNTLANRFATLQNSPDQMDKMSKYVKNPEATIKRFSDMMQLRQTVNLDSQA